MSNMKEIYQSINFSKISNAGLKEQLETIKKETNDFSDADLMDVYKDNFNDLVDIVKAKHPEAMGGKSEAKEKKSGKPAKVKKGKKDKKEKSPKPKKEPIMFKGKPLSEVNCDDLIKDYRERREQSKKNAKTAKTKSIFEKVTDKVESVVEQAIRSIPQEKVSSNPTAFADKIDKLAESTERFLKDFKSILGGEYSATEMEEVVKEIEAIADKVRSKKKK